MPGKKGREGGKASSSWEPDDRDMEILKVLEKDGRASVRRISSMTGIRPSTVHSRMERMERAGAIEGYRAVVDPGVMGRRLTVFMLVTGSTGKYLDEETLRDPCVEEVHGVTGEYDLLMKLRFRDLREFNRFIIEFRERHEGQVSRTITMVETALVK